MANRGLPMAVWLLYLAFDTAARRAWRLRRRHRYQTSGPARDIADIVRYVGRPSLARAELPKRTRTGRSSGKIADG